eukprot:scaffold2997_cov182-Amphora_coffeaeformis.AAC.8
MRRSGSNSHKPRARQHPQATSRVNYKQSILKGPQLDEQEQVLFDHPKKGHSNPGIILIDDNHQQDDKFHDEPTAGFDGDLLYLTEFGGNNSGRHNYNVDDIIAPSTHSRWMAEHAAQQQQQQQSDEDEEEPPKDILVSESTDNWYLGDSTPYRDEPSSPAKRLGAMFTDSLRGNRTSSSSSSPQQWPRHTTDVADPYRDNLHTCDMEALDDNDGDAIMNSNSATRLRSRRRRWCLVAVLLAATVVAVSLVVKHNKNDLDATSQVQKASGGLGGSGASFGDAPTVETEVVHVPEDPTDPRFMHDWSDRDIDYPFTGYALHPVLVGTNYAIRIVAPDAGETTLHVKTGLDASLRTGDVGCGDTPLKTLEPGASTIVQISAEEDTQIVACVFDTVVATTHHFVIPDWWGQERKYILQVLDFQDANLSQHDNTINFFTEDVRSVDHVYALLRKPDGRYAFEYPHAGSAEALQVLMYPHKRQPCSIGGTQQKIKGTHTPHGSPKFELWDMLHRMKNKPGFYYDDREDADAQYEFSTLVYLCADNPKWMLKPLGSVYVAPSFLTGTTSTTTSTIAGPLWGPGVTAPP